MPGMKQTPTPKLRAIDVPCPDCRALRGDPCVNRQGHPLKSVHQARHAYCAELIERSKGSDGSARWLRHRIRQGFIPTKPMSCGTEAAYRRHVRLGEQVDDACLAAARRAWATRSQANRDRAGSTN